MTKNLKLNKKYSQFGITLAFTLGLLGCYNEPYPVDIQQELLNYCQIGIQSGLTVVHHGKDTPMTDKETQQLCQFRLNIFMKEVALSDYLQLNQHIYENFQRAYANKYVLKDIYDTLSPDDKRTNEKIARIMLGLEEKQDATQ
ncbi:hypothetical protein [Pelistega ratti]|uniref:hypothetical protein n=1 Tax=Pelistega ratti TaxID=2652177 RepID=UPI00135BB372|nr:hypothetical protein [Pelistega ratti]